MTEIIIEDWNDGDIASFGRTALRLRHNAHVLPLFEDRILADLIERSARENYYVNTMQPGARDRSTRREGDFGGLSGFEVLDAVRSGHIWILLLNPEIANPQFKVLLDRIYAELAAKVPKLKVKKKKLSVLISSPGIPVFYHCDLPGQTLWQVRGSKTVYVYPNREPYLPQENLEKIVLNEAHEISLPYDPAWDSDAQVFTIEPGDMLHWPLNAPHRVENGPALNVSFTTEHVTPEVQRNFAVNYGNGILRRTFKLGDLSQATRGPAYWGKFATMSAAKLLKLQRGREQTFKVDFAVDRIAPHGWRDIPGYEFKK